MNKIKITLTKAARQEALMTRELRGLTTEAEFEGPVFERATVDWDSLANVCVTCPDGTLYFYAANTVSRVAVYEIT